MMPALDRDEYRAVSVLSSGDYAAFDLADHLADVMSETTAQGRIWDMSALDLALLAVDNYPGGAMGLQLTLMGYEEPLYAEAPSRAQRVTRRVRAFFAHLR